MNLIAKVFFLVVGCSFFCVPLKAQQDSTNLRLQTGKAITDRFASTRFINVEYEYLTPVDYRAKLHNQKLENGRLENQNRVKVNLNVPIYTIDKWTFTGSLRYKYNHSTFGRVENLSTQYPDFTHQRTNDSHTYNVALNSTYITRMFNKPVVYNFGIAGDGSQDKFERITGSAIGTMVVKRDKNMTMTAGLIVIADKMVRFPVLPTFGIEYKMPSDWLLSLSFPYYAYVRKSFSHNGRLSLGTNLDRNRYYVHPDGTNKSYLYSKTEIKTGFVYEHFIQKRLILDVRGGMLNTLKGTLNKKNRSYSKDFLSTTQDAGMYFNVGISYNLF